MDGLDNVRTDPRRSKIMGALWTVRPDVMLSGFQTPAGTQHQWIPSTGAWQTTSVLFREGSIFY